MEGSRASILVSMSVRLFTGGILGTFPPPLLAGKGGTMPGNSCCSPTSGDERMFERLSGDALMFDWEKSCMNL